mgnify:CR=1 FL=1
MSDNATRQIRFSWSGKSATGEEVRGEFFSASKKEAVSFLESRDIQVTKIQREYDFIREMRRRNIKQEQIYVLLEQIAAIMHTGLLLVETLEIIRGAQENIGVSDLIFDILLTNKKNKAIKIIIIADKDETNIEFPVNSNNLEKLVS